MAIKRKGKWWMYSMAALALILIGAKLGRNWIAEKALIRVATLAGKSGYSLTFDDVEFSLLRQHIRIEGLLLAPSDSASYDSLARFTVKADAIDLLGVDAWAMLKEHTLHVGHVELQRPEIHHSFITRAKGAPKRKSEAPREKGGAGSVAIQLDTLLITNAQGSSRDRATSDTTMVIGGIDLLMTAIRIGNGVDGKTSLSLGTAQLDLRNAQARLKPYYGLRIDSMHVRIPANRAMIHGVHLTPDVNAGSYHKEVEFQTELFEINADTIELDDFDLAAHLGDGAISAHHLRVAGANVDIHRDKSVPLRPDPPRKALLAERIQGWDRAVSIDTIVMSRSRISYHERLKRGEAYGTLTFAGIEGRLTGLNNTASNGHTSLHLEGDARVWDRAKAHIDLAMQKDNGPTHLNIAVRLQDLPATELNRMTDDLLNVSATKGRIHLVEMRMKGDDVRASGTVDERYQDLEIALSPQVKHAGVLSFVANRVIRSHNMPGEKGYKVGRFTVERSQEKSVFNYLWLGLRTGMMEVMLPEQVLKQLKKQQEK